jgi:hypothetical protein
MKSKTFRWFLLAAALALITGCMNTNNMTSSEIVALRDSYEYRGPTGFYDPWYGGGAYVGAGGYGGVSIGISAPIVR